MSIKAIGFDQGGILIDVDYDKTLHAFRSLGAINAEKIYTKTEQTDYIDKFEQGKIDARTFRCMIKADLVGLNQNVTDFQIDHAWNAMLLNFRRDSLEFVLSLKTLGYITFLYSNIDDIHYAGVVEASKRDMVDDIFDLCFHQKYYSHIFGHNKPSVSSFTAIANDIYKKYNILSNEILFIDDSSKHIFGRNGQRNEGAINAGLKGLLVKSNLSAFQLRNLVMKELKKYS